jgi:hypothetical protein
MHSIFLPTLNLGIGVPGGGPTARMSYSFPARAFRRHLRGYVVEIDLRITTLHLAWIMVHIYSYAGIVYEV